MKAVMQKKLETALQIKLYFQTFYHRLILQNIMYNFTCLHLTQQASIISKVQKGLNFKSVEKKNN